MEKELLFADKLKELQKTAKAQGNMLTEEQVQETFAEFALKEEQLTLVHDYLKKHQIGIGDALPEEEYLSEEERDFLQLYLEEISETEPLTKGEREAVILSAMAGDQAAQERLLTLMLPQAADVAKLYAGQGVFLEDLIGEGNVALAAGVKMLGAAEQASEAEAMLMRMLMNAMEEYIAENAEESQKDRRIADKVNKVADAARKLSEEYGRKVTAEELSEESGISVKAIRDAMRISGGKIEDLEREA